MSLPWNVLVYIATDDMLYNDAKVSLRQITEASRLSNTKIIVQLDGPGENYASRYECVGGKKTLVWEADDTYTKVPAKRLEFFLEQALPEGKLEERVFLVLWGHGAGLDHVYHYGDPSRSTGSDAGKPQAAGDKAGAANSDTAEEAEALPPDFGNGDDRDANRYISDIQLGTILSDFSKRIHRRIDLLGMDACLMGLVEVCHEVSSAVEVMVASDEESPSKSWPYDAILQDLARFPGMSAEALSVAIASRFVESYAGLRHKKRVSLSSFRLAEWLPFAKAIEELVAALMPFLGDTAAQGKMLRARDLSRISDGQDYIDFAAFCEEISESFDSKLAVSQAAAKVRQLLIEAPHVLYHRDAEENGGFDPYGMAIYFPDTLPPTSEDIEKSPSKIDAQTFDAMHGAAPLMNGKNIPIERTKIVTQEGTKTVTVERTKTVTVRDTKHLQGCQGSGREIIGLDVLWDKYEALQFNEATKWSTFLSKLLPPPPPPAETTPATTTPVPAAVAMPVAGAS